MKRKTLCLLFGCLIIIPLVLTACSNAATEPVLSDAEIQALKEELAERGSCNVETLAVAAAVAGFPIATPDYIPDGFYRQDNIIINQLGGGLPEEMKPKSGPIMVDTFYFWEEDEEVMFFIEQSNGNPGIANAEPTPLCGGPGEKGYEPADPQRKYPSEILTLSTRIGDHHFFIWATLAGPLDEEKMEKIFCSLEYD
jgi:hypothetical protein